VTLGREAVLFIPTLDHYLQLLYVIATRKDGEAIAFPVKGVDGESISMLAVWGGIGSVSRKGNMKWKRSFWCWTSSARSCSR
jgi:hypothetical protein